MTPNQPILEDQGTKGATVWVANFCLTCYLPNPLAISAIQREGRTEAKRRTEGNLFEALKMEWKEKLLVRTIFSPRLWEIRGHSGKSTEVGFRQS